MENKYFNFIILFFALGCALIRPSWALDTGVAGQRIELYPGNLSGESILGVPSAQPLPAGTLYFGLDQSIAIGHLFEVDMNGSLLDIVENQSTTYFSFHYGLTDELGFGLQVPVHFYASETNINSNSSFTTRGLGDLNIFAQWRLVENDETQPGLALITKVFAPTGDKERFFGDESFMPSVELAFTELWPWMQLNATLGYAFRPERTVLGLTLDDTLFYGLGFRFFLPKQFSVLIGARGQFMPTAAEEVTSPIEVNVGLSKQLNEQLSMTIGGGRSINSALGAPDFRATLQLQWTLGF